MFATMPRRILCAGALVTLLSACEVPVGLLTANPTSTSTSAPPTLAIPTNTPGRTPIFVPSATPQLTSAFIPTATGTPALTAPATPLPATIGPANVAQVREIASWKARDRYSFQKVAWSPDTQTLAALEIDRVVLYQVPGGDVLRIINGPHYSIAISPDGRMLAAGTEDNGLKVWEVRTGRELLDLGQHSSALHAVAFSPDSRLLFAGSTYGAQKLWDVTTSKEVATLGTTVVGVVLSAAFSPDGKWLAVGTGSSRGGSVEVRQVANVDELYRLDDGRDDKYGLAFSPDGRLLASGSLYGNVKFWDLAAKSELSRLNVPQSSVNSVAFSPQGDLIAIAARESIRLLQVPSARELSVLSGHTDTVNTVAFSPDGRWLASGSADGTLRLWGIEP